MSTNTVPPGMLPLPVQQAAAARGLWAFLKTYTVSLRGTIVGACFFLLGAALFCVGSIFPPDLTITTRGLLLVSALFFLGLALSLAWSVIQVANQQVYLFEQGLVVERGKQVQVFPWNQVAAVWQSITRTYRNGRYAGTTYVYTLRRADGYQVKLNNLTKDIAELGAALAQGITRELVPQALHSLQAGQTLTFASLSINREGISNGQAFLPWSQVQGIDVQQGRVSVKKTGTARAFWTNRVAKIPNFLVFMAVTSEMLRRASAARKPESL